VVSGVIRSAGCRHNKLIFGSPTPLTFAILGVLIAFQRSAVFSYYLIIYIFNYVN
jgi:hypothetical protein